MAETSDHDQERDEVQAASVTPADVGETPPAQDGPGEPRSIFEPSDKVKEWVRARVGQVPDRRNPEEHTPEVENTTADRDAVRRRIALDAWTASLEASDVLDLARWRLDRLADDQHPTELRGLTSVLPRSRFRNLLFVGDVGPGKTSAAIAVGWAAIEKGMTVRFIEHAKYLRWLRPAGPPPKPHPYHAVTQEQLRMRMTRCDVLVLDDLAASMDPTVAATGHAKEETMTLIGDRIDTPGAITIITTNRRSDELGTMFGDQFLSRLSKYGRVLRFSGPDRRGRLSW